MTSRQVPRFDSVPCLGVWWKIARGGAERLRLKRDRCERAVDLLRHPGANQTGPRRFGHFSAEVPKSLHIGPYPRVFLNEASDGAITKPLQPATFAARGLRRPA